MRRGTLLEVLRRRHGAGSCSQLEGCMSRLQMPRVHSDAQTASSARTPNAAPLQSAVVGARVISSVKLVVFSPWPPSRRSLCGGQLSSPPYSGRRFANFQRQRGPASPPISVFCADAPFKVKYVGRGGIHAIHVLCVQKERLRGPLCTVTVTKTTVTSQTHGDRAARAP